MKSETIYEILYWVLFLIYALFQQHLMLKGWKGCPYKSFEKGLHNAYEWMAFEAHQACWLAVCLVSDVTKRQPEFATTSLWLHVAGLLFCTLGYSKWHEYTTCMSVSSALQFGVTVTALGRELTPLPVKSWLFCTLFSAALLLQLPGLVINRIYTGDVEHYEKKMTEKMFDILRPSIFFSSLIDNEEEEEEGGGNEAYAYPPKEDKKPLVNPQKKRVDIN